MAWRPARDGGVFVDSALWRTGRKAPLTAVIYHTRIGDTFGVRAVRTSVPRQPSPSDQVRILGSSGEYHPNNRVRSLHQVGWNDHVRSSINGEDAPLAGNAFQRELAAIDKLQPGARHQILHGTRNENLARPSHRGDARADMDRDTPDIVVNFLAFAGVKPSSNIDPERTNFFDDCAGAADCAPRPVEGDEETVTSRVGLASAKAHNVSSNRGIM